MANSDVVDFNVLESISVITKKLAGSKLKIRQTQEFLKAEENLNKYFRTTTYGTWILCGIISYYFDNDGEECNFNNLASFFSVPVMSIIAYKTDVEALLSKGYIKNSRTLKKNEIGLKNEFKVSQELLNFILHNKKIEELHNNDSDDSILEGLKIFGQAIENSEDWIGKILQLKEFEDYLPRWSDEKHLPIPTQQHMDRWYVAWNDFVNEVLKEKYSDVVDMFYNIPIGKPTKETVDKKEPIKEEPTPVQKEPQKPMTEWERVQMLMNKNKK